MAQKSAHITKRWCDSFSGARVLVRWSSSLRFFRCAIFDAAKQSSRLPQRDAHASHSKQWSYLAKFVQACSKQQCPALSFWEKSYKRSNLGARLYILWEISSKLRFTNCSLSIWHAVRRVRILYPPRTKAASERQSFLLFITRSLFAALLSSCLIDASDHRRRRNICGLSVRWLTIRYVATYAFSNFCILIQLARIVHKYLFM